MTPTQLNHTAAVLAQMLTFEHPADGGLATNLLERRVSNSQRANLLHNADN